MKHLVSGFLASLMALLAVSPVEAGCFQRFFQRHRQRASYSMTYSSQSVQQSFQAAPSCQSPQMVPSYQSPQMVPSYQSPQMVPSYQSPQMVPQAAPPPPVMLEYHSSSFLVWLNSARAAYGLRAVVVDPNLNGWAAANNSHQLARGLGHFVMGPARRQNSGSGSLQSVQQMWMASPAHSSALLDPTITRIGLHQSGSYWTFSAY